MPELYKFNTSSNAVFREKRELFSPILLYTCQSAVGIINKAICVEGQMEIRRLAPFSLQGDLFRDQSVCIEGF